MRIDDQSTHIDLLNSIEQARSRMNKYEEQVSTGQTLQRPSDDPSAYELKSRLDAQVSRMGQDLTMMQGSTATLDTADQVLGDLSADVNSLRSLAQQADNAPTDQAPGALADQVNAILESALDSANTNLTGTYLLAGSRSRTQPFQAQRANGEISAVTYVGDLGSPPLSLPGGKTMKLNLNGQSVSSGSGYDLFTTAIAMRDAIKAGTFKASDYLDKLASIGDNLLQRRAEAASAANHLQTLTTSTSALRQNLQVQVQNLTGTDMPSAITSLTASETSLQAALEVAAKSSQLSLVSFLK